MKLDKTHTNDAFVIAGGTSQPQNKTFQVIQVRRNNRSLQKFYDAKYEDLRDGKIKKGNELSNQRRNKNTEKNDNLRVFRGHKTKEGRRSIRKNRYSFQPKDIVIYDGKKVNTPIKCKVKGTFNKGNWVRLKYQGKTINSNVKNVEPYCYGKGFCIS